MGQTALPEQITNEPITDLVDEIMNQRETDIINDEEKFDKLLDFGDDKDDEESECESENEDFPRKTNQNDNVIGSISFNTLCLNTVGQNEMYQSSNNESDKKSSTSTEEQMNTDQPVQQEISIINQEDF
jgi:hypothetical protein